MKILLITHNRSCFFCCAYLVIYLGYVKEREREREREKKKKDVDFFIMIYI